MLYVLILICINGAQGCTYSKGNTVIVGEVNGSVLPTYSSESACQKVADRFNARYNDPGLFEVCRTVGRPL